MALLSVADALARVLAHAAPLPVEQVAIDVAHGRVLAEDLTALRTQPPGDVSAMDGYAVRAADLHTLPARLKVIGEVAAGHPFDEEIGSGEAARIFTGGLLPPGADMVVIQEDVAREGDWIIVRQAGGVGKHVRHAGIDFRDGDRLLAKGRRLSGRDVTLAAAMNRGTLAVHRPPKVALLATGDELIWPGREPKRGEIVYSNGYAIAALARAEGAETVNLGIAPDRLEEIVAAMRRARALGVDLLVTTGGASVGERDLMHRALAAEGADLSFWKVALRPGRPLMHGRLGEMHVLGLPGNPVSAFVCSLIFMVPLLRKMSGRGDVQTESESARLAVPLKANDGREDYLRASLAPASDGGPPLATPFPSQDSSLMRPLAQANCLIIRPPFAPVAEAGDPCRILRLPF
ncbi:MAG TPA: gephyrin-like molybdotransferase Glp [Pseudorhodoplanes sp.]|nr:gephyrin-like molybdotransferase Glp [Pseudorhodoplanes sp.]